MGAEGDHTAAAAAEQTQQLVGHTARPSTVRAQAVLLEGPVRVVLVVFACPKDLEATDMVDGLLSAGESRRESLSELLSWPSPAPAGSSRLCNRLG
jgi:hypothetical protein